MTRVIWIVTLFATCICGNFGTARHHIHSQWMLTQPRETVTETPERTVCLTPQCKELATLLTQSMNRSANPCEDFYEYSCGNWAKHNPLPPDEKRWNVMRILQQRVEDRIKEIIDEGPKPDDFHSSRLAKRAFKACMNTDEIERVGLQPLVSTIWSTGGWPLIMEENEWDEKLYLWHNVDDYYARLIGLNSFHDLHVTMDYWNPEKVFFMIQEPHLPRKMYKLLSPDEEMKGDSSDENNESGEGSQERGSEERGEEEDKQNDDYYDYDDYYLDGQNDDDEDLYKLQRGKMTKKKIHNLVAHKSRLNHRVERSRKHVDEKKMKERTRIDVKQLKAHNKKAHNREANGRRIKRHLSKGTANLESKPDSIKKPVGTDVSGHNNRIKNVNDDLYLDDDSSENGNNSGDQGKDNDGNEENDEGSDNNVSENGSDNSDYEWPPQDYSSSGDYEWDEEDGSGSGDDSDDRGSGDDESEENEAQKEERRKEAEEMRNKYAEYILNVSLVLAKARGVPVSKERLAKDIVDLVEFQMKLLKYAYYSGTELNTTLEELQERYDNLKPETCNGKVNWIRKVQDAFSNHGMEIDKDTNIFVSSFKYMKNLRKLLDTTPSRTIVNYVHWNFISRVIKATTKEMREMYANWEDEQLRETKRARNCVSEMKAQYILGYDYIKKYFSDSLTQMALDMADDIQKEVEYEIKDSPWVNDEVKHIVLDKLVFMKKVIGYPEWYRNTTILKEDLRGLSVTKSHYDNMLSIMRYIKMRSLKILFTKEFSEYMYANPLIVNAFYSFDNTIEITAADFQSPFFDPKQPWYTNYGIMGLIIGHEVNHGFDNNGHLADKDGMHADWPLEMEKEYEKRLQCFIDQFNRYSMVENRTAHTPIEDYGVHTAGENIADTMGLKAVFKAYQRRLRKCKTPDPKLPGLEDLTNEQLFFLSFGHVWCEVANPETYPSDLKRDPHSPGPLRVIGSVSNTEDFAKAYNCPLGSPMNPEKKCSIWK